MLFNLFSKMTVFLELQNLETESVPLFQMHDLTGRLGRVNSPDDFHALRPDSSIVKEMLDRCLTLFALDF